MLDAQNIVVSRGRVQVLWGLSLYVLKGEIVSVIGSNGAGKTTILKTLSGLLHPLSGMIRFLDRRIDQLEPDKIVSLGLVQVPEGRQLFPSLTVLENLEAGSYIPRARKKRPETLETVFAIFPILKQRKDQRSGTLSGGEQQMLAIGRSLMALPELLMLDEPSLGLAPVLVDEMFFAVQRLKAQGKTILIVEQNVMQSLSLSDRGYVLENGRIILNGDARTLLLDEGVKKAYLGLA